jgi:hypothetical protein
MTTTYNAPSFTNKSPVTTTGLAKDIKAFRDTVTFTAALGLNDGGTVCYLPPNAVVLGGYVKFPIALDTNGSPTLTIDLGVTGTAQNFLAADTTARAGGVQKTFATTGVGYKNTSGAKLAVTWLAHAAAATGAAGTMEVHLSYVIEDSTTSP